MSNTMTGAELRAFREGRGLSQPGLADLVNGLAKTKADKTVVSKWENGKLSIPADVASKLREITAAEPAGIPAKLGPAVVTCVANQKGGVAKTGTAVNLAYALAKAGRRVLLVDADPQGSAAVHLGLKPYLLEREGKTLTHVLAKNVLTEAAIVPAHNGLFDILASSIALAEVEVAMMADPTSSLALREKLGEVADQFAHIVVDCPPNLGMMATSALNASDRVLIPSQLEMLSVMGIPLLLSTIEKVRRRINPKIATLGILPTQVHRRSQDAAMKEELDGLAAKHGLKIYPGIKDSKQYPDAVTEGIPALAMRNPVGVESFTDIVNDLTMLEAPAKETVHG